MLYVHQSSGFTHFSSMGYTESGAEQESSLSTKTNYPRYMSPAPILNRITRLQVKNIDPVTVALQEDINK